jgi:protein-export SecD/SecF family membrane protein
MKTKGRSIIALIILVAIAAGLAFTAAFGIGDDGKLGIKKIKRGLDLSGGVTIVYQASKENPTDDEMSMAVTLIRHRLDRKGWTEAECSKQGSNRIRVEIPGVADAESAVNELGKTAQLSFTDEKGNVLLTGADIKDAKKEVGSTKQNGSPEPYVSLEFTDNGKKLFADATTANVGKIIYITMDKDVISAPKVDTAITDGKAIISGSFTAESAQELADLIKEGAMPFDLTVMEMNNIGARLGTNAIQTSLKSAVVGVALVLLFMLIMYRLSGFAADWALIVYMALEVIVLSGLRVTLTLPGIAGVILSVGMAVDANVIIFERLKEEIKIGRSIRSAVKNSFAKALPAILDGNITTLIAAIILYFMGTGTIKGFALTLIIGILLSMFTALVITRLIIMGIVGLGVSKPGLFAVKLDKKEKVQ